MSSATSVSSLDDHRIARPSTLDELPAAERKRRTAQLIDRARRADGERRRDLLDEVILLNIPVALSLAARYRHRGQPLEELQQVACLALTRAVRAFRPDQGEDLLVYAVPSIAGELKRYFRDSSWTVRPPRRLQELRPRIAVAEEQLLQELGRSPRPAELAAAAGCTEDDVIDALSCTDVTNPDRLDAEQRDGAGTARIDRLAADETGYEWTETVATLAPACRRLKQRDRLILRLRFYDQLTQQQIADRLGVTQVQVSRLLQRILADVRRAIEGSGRKRAA